MSTLPPSRTVVRRTIAGAVIACATALGLFLALPPRGEPPPQFLEFLGRFHTLAVHLPIGVLLLIATAELLTRNPRVRARVDPALDLALPFLVLSAVAAFSLGVLLARGGGYPPKLVALHRGFTLGAVLGSAACLLAWTTRMRAEGVERRAPYRALLASTVALLTIGAHFGGSLTHGESYLTRYAPAFVQDLIGAAPPAPPEPVATAPVSEPLVFASAVAPILNRECVPCHGPDKTKGGLRLDSMAGILKGGEHGAAAVAGHGAESLLVKRMRLPAGDDDHMPPAEKPQPSAGEIDLLTWWIDRGANDTLRVKDAIVPDAARTILGRSIDRSSILDAPDPAPAPPRSAPEPVPVAAASPSPAPPPATGARLAYRDVIAPMLAASCGKCHGSAKQKGKLRVDSIAALTTGGKSGPGVVASDAARGTVLGRVRLPPDDDKHMPPRDEHALSSAQIATLASWVSRGANETMLASALPGGGAPARASAANAKSASPGATHENASAKVPAPASSAASVLAQLDVGPGQIALYRDVVAPLLTRRCGECHSGKRDEGGMRVDDLAALLRDEEIVAGKPEASPIAKRMGLAASDADRMPPPEKPPADAWEASAVSMWIARGARADLVVAASDLPANVAEAMNVGAAAAPTTAAAPPSARATPTPTTTLPPGAVIEPRASGCGACTVGVDARGSSIDLVPAAAVVALAFTRRRRRTRRRRASEP